jgi:hypothetical protein
VDLIFYFGIDPELLTPDKSCSLKLQEVAALTEQANSGLALTASSTRRWCQKLVFGRFLDLKGLINKFLERRLEEYLLPR